MNPAKLRRSRDVSEIQRSKIEKGFRISDDRTIELTFPSNPDGKYFLKGGTPAAWDEFSLPDKWRSKLGEGLIEGKRCGTTQNIGPTARLRSLIYNPVKSEIA